MTRAAKTELTISISLTVLFFLFVAWVVHWSNQHTLMCQKKWPGSVSEGPLLHPKCVEKRVLGEP